MLFYGERQRDTAQLLTVVIARVIDASALVITTDISYAVDVSNYKFPIVIACFHNRITALQRVQFGAPHVCEITADRIKAIFGT